VNQDRNGWRHVSIWEFRVRAGMEERFEQVYGLRGEWARFFQPDDSYIGTELIRDLKEARTYVTLDFWVSKKDYDDFRQKHLAEYSAIDQKCEAMTESEREIGTFIRVTSE
jgi:heme-degrading monooxygenase HmoA